MEVVTAEHNTYFLYLRLEALCSSFAFTAYATEQGKRTKETWARQGQGDYSQLMI